MGVVGVYLPSLREFGGREPRKNYIYRHNAKSCILVHPWFRKLAAADRRGPEAQLGSEGWVGKGVTPKASTSKRRVEDAESVDEVECGGTSTHL